MIKLSVVFILMINSFYSQNQGLDTIKLGHLDSNYLKQGVWKVYDSVRFIEYDYTYKNDTLNGVTRVILGKFTEEYFYEKGIKNGWSKEYYKGKVTKSFLYKNDSLIYFIRFDLKGRISEEYGIHNGLKNGRSIIYKKGKIVHEEFFNDGKENGFMLSYNTKSAIPTSLRLYKDGFRTNFWVSFDKTGKIKDGNTPSVPSIDTPNETSKKK